ncbi:MAG: DNA topoisomerase (ATP-hydrolyzing) subunit A [Planctomycetaceae bacterium]
MVDKAEGTGTGAAAPDEGDRLRYVSISQESKRRYLNYAVSVIISRALPDIRDGLKPVQRRLLFTMFDSLRLLFDARYAKSMKIYGETVGNFHPHGEAATYEALARMAQGFSLRYPLVDGWGNFGSVMGLPPAAARYTEARLTALACELMSELKFDTAPFRPTYDQQREEPVVLPARYPNLLVNGAQGIAVGMATSIPPHNLTEVIDACIALIGDRTLSVAQLMRHIRGPDFPLGGRIVTERKELRTMYEEGRGSIKVRGEWEPDREKRREVPDRVVITSIPYGVESGPLLQAIGDIVANRKLPQLLDCADLSDKDHELKILLKLRPGADPNVVMAYLYKHTALEQNFSYNSIALVPDEHGGLTPQRMNLADMLLAFLDFRFTTVKRRFSFQLKQLQKRIHLLRGFQLIFDGLDRALKIIRNSTGKADAATKLMAAFALDAEQTNAILEMMLYKISQLEIDDILGELREKKKAAAEIEAILGSNRRLWKVVETELTELRDRFGDKRRTTLGSSEEVADFNPEAYIVKENTNVVLSREGWVKRVGRLASVESTRVREGDDVLAVVPGSTLDQVLFFSSEGVVYTARIDTVPVSSGYGEPVSKNFKLGDGAAIIAALSTDSRFTPDDHKVKGQEQPGPYLIVATAKGQVMRLPLQPFRTGSTRSGRKFCRLAPGDRVVFVELQREATSMFLASAQARVLHFAIDEVPVLSGAGKGARGMRIAPDDAVLGAALLSRPSDCLRIESTGGKEMVFGQQKYELTSRGGKGIRTIQRAGFAKILRPAIELVDWAALEAK